MTKEIKLLLLCSSQSVVQICQIWINHPPVQFLSPSQIVITTLPAGVKHLTVLGLTTADSLGRLINCPVFPTDHPTARWNF